MITIILCTLLCRSLERGRKALRLLGREQQSLSPHGAIFLLVPSDHAIAIRLRHPKASTSANEVPRERHRRAGVGGAIVVAASPNADRRVPEMREDVIAGPHGEQVDGDRCRRGRELCACALCPIEATTRSAPSVTRRRALPFHPLRRSRNALRSSRCERGESTRGRPLR